MRRLLALAWLLLPVLSFGQAYTTITATNVTVDNGSGTAVNPPSSSQLCFLGVNNAGSPITYTPSGGSPVSGTVCGTLNGSGGLTGSLTVANPATASPLGLLYTITVINSGTTYLTIPTVSLSGTVWSYDAYALPGTGVAVGIGKPHIACSGGAQWTSTTLPPGQTNALCNSAGSWQPYPPAPYCPSGQAYQVPQSGGMPFCLPPVTSTLAAPTGSCIQNAMNIEQDNGALWGCKATAWVVLASSSPGVTSIQGATGSFTFNGSGFSGCSTSGGSTTCTFAGGGTTLPSTHQILAGNGSGGAVATALDDGQTTPGTVTSSEPVATKSTASSTPAVLATNTGSSSNSVLPAAFLCPNAPLAGISGCPIVVGQAATDSNGLVAAFGWLNGGSSSAERGFLGMGTQTGTTTKHAFRWDYLGNSYFPQLLNISCLGTDSNGQLGPGSGCTSSGGTVTSVGLLLPASLFSISGSPVTASGTLTATFATQSANQFFAGPASGSPTTPAFRALVSADLPIGSSSQIGGLECGSGTTCSGGVLSVTPGSSVSVNGSSVASPNFNGTTPAAGTNGRNVTWQSSVSSVSAEIVGDGNAAHYLDGTGNYSTPAGGGSTTPAASNAIYNGAITAAMANSITNNAAMFSNTNTPYWEPSPLYPQAFILDDYYYFSNAPSTVNPTTLLKFMNNMVAAVSGGNFPIALSSSGAAAFFYSGCQTDHTTVTGDGQFIMPQMALLYWKLTGSTSWFSTNAATLKTALLNVPLNGTTHLVTVDPLHPWVTWGFQDAVIKTGDDLFGSLLMWRAATDMATLYTEIGDSANATTFTTIASNIAASLTTSSALWDSTDGMFLAATTQNNQIDVFGSAYAVYLGFISGPQQTAISTYLNAHYSTLVVNGFVHESPSNWAVSTGGNQCGHSTGNYDDGEWSVANKWIYYALRVNSPSQAQQLMTDYANNSDPSKEWYGASANGSTPNIASVAPSVAVATANYPGAVNLYTYYVNQPPGCGTLQILDTFAGPFGATLYSHLDNCLNGWLSWTPDTITALLALNGNGQAIYTDSSGIRNAAAINTHTLSGADYTVTTTFTVINNASYSAQVFARVQGATTGTAYYLLCGTNGATANACQLAKLVSGTNTWLGTAWPITWTNNTSHTLAIKVLGTAITGYVDGVNQTGLSATDSSITTKGFAGFGEYSQSNVLASNFQVQ